MLQYVRRKAMARSNTATSDTGSVMTLVAGGDSAGLLRGPRARINARAAPASLKTPTIAKFVPGSDKSIAMKEGL